MQKETKIDLLLKAFTSIFGVIEDGRKNPIKITIEVDEKLGNELSYNIKKYAENSLGSFQQPSIKIPKSDIIPFYNKLISPMGFEITIIKK